MAYIVGYSLYCSIYILEEGGSRLLWLLYMALEILVDLSGIYYGYRLPAHMTNLIRETLFWRK